MHEKENIKYLFDKIKISRIEESIIENVFLEGSNIIEDDVYLLKEINQEMANGNPYVVLVVPEPFAQISREARELIASNKLGNNTIAKAIIVKTLAHKLIVDFYLAVNKPFMKTKTFNAKEPALLWLKEQLELNGYRP